jgi:prepilin-type N-terminal cleavage/methylation domain-containing protein
MKFLLKKKGFSLTELMIVVVVLGILSAVAIPVYKGVSKTQRINDCVMNRQMISIVVQEAMNGMLDNGKKQDIIDMDKIADDNATHKTTSPSDFPEGYSNRACFILTYDENTAFTLGDVRGGYRNITTYPDYDDGCEAGFFLKREGLAGVKMYTKLANAEIPQCAFEESDNAEYQYYIFNDGTVLCDCPECLETIEPLTTNE